MTRRHRRPRPPVAVALMVLALLAAACGGGGDGPSAAPGGTSSSAPRPVTVVLDWTPNTNHAGVYLAEANGWYAEEGLDVRIVEPGEDGALGQLAVGNAEFGFSVAESLIPARAQGVPVVSLAAVIAHNTSSLVAPADRGITRPADLQGRTYGGFGGELERALVETLVRCDGGDPSTVRFVEVGNVDYRVGLERGDYDFVWLFDGWDVIRLRDLGGMELSTIPFVEHTDCIPDWYTPVIAAPEALVGDDPELVRSFMAATARGYAAAMQDPAAAADALLSGAPESDAELVRRSAAYLATRYAPSPEVWGQQDPEVWARFTEFVEASGLVEGEVDSDAAFTDEFLPRR